MYYRCLSIYLLMDIWVVSSFLLLQIKLLWSFVYKSLYGHIFPFPLGRYLGIEWLYNTVGMFNFLRNCQTVFQRGCTILHPTSSLWEFQSLHIPTSTWCVVFLILAILTGMLWYYILVVTWWLISWVYILLGSLIPLIWSICD